jgi:hypothetical protein
MKEGHISSKKIHQGRNKGREEQRKDMYQGRNKGKGIYQGKSTGRNT